MEALEALNTALQREQQGQRFYREAASRTTNEKGKKLFQWLAEEETGHIKLLEQSIAYMKDNAAWSTQDMWGVGKHVTEPVKSSEFPSKADIMGNLSESSPELEILKKAIQAEKEDAHFYTELANSVADPDGKKMIEKLAHVEKGHVELLEEEYEWIHHSKDLFTLHRFSPMG